MRERTPVYVISVAARLLDVHPQTLRNYERAGFLRPTRTEGRRRLYSAEDIEELRSLIGRVEQPGESLRVARGARATATGVFHLLRRDDFAIRAGLPAARTGAHRARRAGRAGARAGAGGRPGPARRVAIVHRVARRTLGL